MATNHFKGKFHEGTFVNGEGPVLGQTVSHEEETKGLLNPASPERHLSTEGGKGDFVLAGTPSDKNFDLHSKTYAGPAEFNTPKNEGESNPHDVK